MVEADVVEDAKYPLLSLTALLLPFVGQDDILSEQYRSLDILTRTWLTSCPSSRGSQNFRIFSIKLNIFEHCGWLPANGYDTQATDRETNGYCSASKK